MVLQPESSAPLVAVVGATGAQGGSVINELIASDKAYRLRGLTRDTSKPAAQKLAEQGVEMVSVTLHAENLKETTKAFEGASIVFAVTSFWEHMDKNREVAEGKMMVDAALAAGVKLFVWSGLVSCTDVSGGKYTHVYHFDGKAEVTKYANERGLPIANVQPASYMSNFETMMKPQKQEDGSFVIAQPSSPNSVMPQLDTKHDYGLFVRAAIEHPELGAGSTIYACGEASPWTEVVKEFSEETGKEVKFVEISEEQYMKFPFSSEVVAKELLQMTQFIAEFGYFGDVDIKSSLKYLPRQPRSIRDYLKATDYGKLLA